MIQNKVYKLKKDTTLQDGLTFKMGAEFHIVMDVVYMNGAMLPPNMQPLFYNWITKNPTLFIDDTRF